MGLKIFCTQFSKIGNQVSLRPDPKYRNFWDINKGITYNTRNLIPLNHVIKEAEVKKFKKGSLDKDRYLVNLSDQKPKCIKLMNVKEVSKINSDKNFLGEADLIISKLGLPKGYVFINEPLYENLIGSTELIPYKLINKEFNPKFLKYLLLLNEILDKFKALESGKTPSHKRVNPFDLLKIKIPLIPKNKQKNALIEIETKESEIKTLMNKIDEPIEIINNIFAKIFDYESSLWKEFGKGMTAGTQKSNIKQLNTYQLQFKNISHNNLWRFSTRFHNPLTQKIYKILHEGDTIKIKDVITEPIRRGLQPRIDPNGEILAIKTAQLKNSYIDISSCDLVSSKFFNNKKKAHIKEGDILLASSGKGSLGKIDIVDFNEKGMVDSHISKIRIDEDKYDRLFLVYLFRSIMGLFQLERDYTGATNQIELSPDEIMNFDIPNISLKSQKEIVQKIKTELDHQKKIESLIEIKTLEISKIIENTICI